MGTKLLFLPLCLIFLRIPGSIAWGTFGHRTVAYLAEMYFTDQAKSYVSNILNGEDISDAAIWADEVREHCQHGWHFSAPWHFIDAAGDPSTTCGVSYDRDCGDPGCVVGAIVTQTSRVNDPDLSTAQREYAMRFLLHFVGDIHQPLHTVGYERGANEFPVNFYGRHHLNLHGCWDKEIPERHARVHGDEEMDDARAWAQTLYGGGSEETMDECVDLADPEKCAIRWAKEANRWVCKFVFRNIDEGDNLEGAYYEGAVPIVDDLIGKAGRRLGAWVNALAAQNAQMVREGRLLEQGYKTGLRRRRSREHFDCPDPDA